jgi:hypothetical protein
MLRQKQTRAEAVAGYPALDNPVDRITKANIDSLLAKLGGCPDGRFK